jgi:glycosyltransferase involved in cell wall biosynthesis
VNLCAAEPTLDLQREAIKNVSTVDVVVPCYNYSRYLRACVQSVLAQTDVQVRVLIIDDASTDDTARVAEALAASDSRVEFRRHKVNRGHIETYNEGLLGWSHAEYTVLLSADDMLAPGSLGRAARIMNADPRIGLVYGSTIHFRSESELPKVEDGDLSYSRWTGAEWLEGRCRTGHNVITSPEAVVRGSIQRAVGGYRPELPHAGDLEMWLRFAAVSDIAYVRRVPQAFYRVHSDSMIRTVYSGHLFDLYQRKEAFDIFFQHYRAAIKDPDYLHDLAKRALAREALWLACRAYDHNQVEQWRAADLVEFAVATYSGASSLPEWSALRHREWLGPVLCNKTQIFAFPAMIRAIRKRIRKERWKRRGV